MICDICNLYFKYIFTCNICTSLPNLAMATAGGESRDAHITIDSERTPAKVIDIRELVENAKDFLPFPVVSFSCKKVPVTKLARRVRSTYKVAKDIGARLTSQ